MEKVSKYLLFSSYVIVSIIALFFVSFKLWIPLSSADYQMIMIYLMLLIIVNSSPLIFGHIMIIFTFAVSLTIFLEYGLVVEIWLTQIAVLVSTMITVLKRNIYRSILSQMMFIWISLAAGFSFFLAGGTIGFTVPMVKYQLIPIALYTFSFFMSNHLILYILRLLNEQRRIPFLSENVFWYAATFLITLPLGVILYLAKIIYSTIGMLFVSLLIIIVTQLFKLYRDSVHFHQQLKSFNKLSASFTSELNLEKTVSALQQSIRELLTFNHSYIFLTDEDKLKLISVENYHGQVIEDDHLKKFQLALGEGLSGRVALIKKAHIVNDNVDIYKIDTDLDYIKENKALLSVPMLWNNKTVGVITLGDTEEYHFSKKDMTIANILASQAAVAIKNARVYQKTEERSLIDELTGVYNFRAFEDILQSMAAETEMENGTVNLLMLDIDHFKRVNDQYGHSAGNEVLKQIIQILKEHTRKEDVIARYGGEEFTVIIPGTDYTGAERIAERIRDAVQKMDFKIKDSLHNKGEIVINVTVSIGIASYPDMAQSVKELIRYADRAMYVGAKQAGRNRVAVYKAS